MLMLSFLETWTSLRPQTSLWRVARICQVSLESLFTWWFFKWFFRYPRCYSLGALPKLKQTILQLTCPKSKVLLAHKVREEGSEASNENPMKAQSEQWSRILGVGWWKLQLHLCLRCDCICWKELHMILPSNDMGYITHNNLAYMYYMYYM